MQYNFSLCVFICHLGNAGKVHPLEFLMTSDEEKSGGFIMARNRRIIATGSLHGPHFFYFVISEIEIKLATNVPRAYPFPIFLNEGLLYYESNTCFSNHK